MELWKRAVQALEGQLTHNELELFRSADPEHILADIHRLEEEHRRSSKIRRILVKLKPLLDATEDYGRALDVIANTSSVLPPLWGSLRVLLAAAHRYESRFQRLLDMIAMITDALPRFSTYARILEFHEPLQDALTQAHIQMVIFFTRARSMFRESSVRVRFKMERRSLEKDFEDCINEMRRYWSLVEAESKVATIKLQVQERERAESERQRAEEGRRKAKREEDRIWLSARKCSEEKKIVQTRLLGTCEWIVHRSEVAEWLNSPDQQVLWVHGPPGCGKSYLYGRMLETLEERHPAAYFMFCGGDKERVTLTSLLRSWCLQLLELFSLSDCLEKVKSKHGNRVASSTDILELFPLLLDQSPAIYLTVDALDECSEREEVLRLLSTIPARVKIFMTSRTPANLRKDVASIRKATHTLEILPEHSKGDVEYYIAATLEGAGLPCREEISEKVRQRLLRSEGMFLWVRLMIEHLQAQTCEYELLQCMEELPEGLPQTYDAIMCRIDRLPRNRKMLAYKVFFWGITVMRPVSAAELRCLLAIQPKSDELDDTRMISDMQCAIPAVCGGLIRLRGEEKILYFTHFTVTEYLQEHLTKSDILREIAACYEAQELTSNDQLAAAICLRYLCYDFIGALPLADTSDEARGLLEQEDPRFALLGYATSGMAHHVRRVASLVPLMEQLALLFFDASRPNLLVWWHLYWPLVVRPRATNPDKSYSSLHMASATGLTVVVRALLRRDGVPIPPRDGRSPLWLAASYGHAETTDALMKAGFSAVETENKLHYPLAPVHVAVNHLDVTKSIMRHTSPDEFFLADEKGNTALHWAVWQRDNSAVSLILEYWSQKMEATSGNNRYFDLKNRHGDTALHSAVLLDHAEAVGALAKHVDLNCQDEKSRTALYLASARGNTSIVEILLSHGADQTIQDHNGRTALHRAAERGHSAVVEILLAHGADLVIQDNLKRTPLHHAAWGEHVDVIKILLAHGADHTVDDFYGKTALEIMEERGGPYEVVKLLRSLRDEQRKINAARKTTAPTTKAVEVDSVCTSLSGVTLTP